MVLLIIPIFPPSTRLDVVVTHVDSVSPSRLAESVERQPTSTEAQAAQFFSALRGVLHAGWTVGPVLTIFVLLKLVLRVLVNRLQFAAHPALDSGFHDSCQRMEFIGEGGTYSRGSCRFFRL